MSSFFQIRHIVYFLMIATVTPHTIYTEEIADESTTISNETSTSHQKLHAQKLQVVIENSNLVMTNVRNTLIQVSMLLQKYGKNIDRKDAAIKELHELISQLESFAQNKIHSILHYLQQDFSTLPEEGYQEIYEVFDSILKGTNQVLDTLKKQIKDNFKEPLDMGFLTIKGHDFLNNESVDPDALTQYCKLVLQNSADLYMTGTTIGLSEYNKACRLLNKYIVQPCLRYHVGEIIQVTGFSIISSLFIYWVTNCEKYESPKEIAELQRNLNINNQTQGSAVPPETIAATVNNGSAKESKTRLTLFVEWLCGKVPTSVDGRWCMPGASEKDLTKWNRFMCLLYNCLPNHTNPITAMICYGGAGYFGNKYGLPLIPVIKSLIANWWQQSLGGASAEMTPVGTWEYDSQVTLDNVIGLQPIKDRLAPAIAYAENPEKYAQTASSIPTNYIFYGLRRTGKSFMAKAIAGEMKKRNRNIKTLNIPCDAFREMGVQQTIDFIRAHAPCIAFIDEADLGNFARSLDRRTTGELLKALGDGNISPDPSRPVFLIFATNKLEAIDTSLAALGRFGASVLFTNPSLIDRWQFIFAKLQSIGLNPQDFDIDKLAEKTEGNSLEEIDHCITIAKQIAIEHNAIISTELVIATINEVLHGIYPEYPRELHKEAINVLCAHFAGKALVTALTESNEILDTVSICRRKLPLIEDENSAFSGKPTHQPKYNYGIMLTRQQSVTENNAGPVITKSYYMRILAGVVAEEIILGKATNQCHAEPWNNDSVIKAYSTAMKESSEGGLYWYFDTQMGDAQKGEYFAKAKALIEGYKQEVQTLLEQHREALDVIMRALKLFGTLNDGIVLNIIENPAAVLEQINEIEKKQEEEYKKRMAEYQSAQAAVAA